VLPGEPLVSAGPYRYLSHPNYAVVPARSRCFRWCFTCRWLAVVFTLLNAAVLAIRIRAENRALAFRRSPGVSAPWRHERHTEVRTRPGCRTSAAIWLGFVLMCLGMFMAILDIQVVATSLPTIQNALAISPDAMSWIQTAYLIAEVIAIPLTGLLTRVLTLRWLFVRRSVSSPSPRSAARQRRFRRC
jgi:DHA2 family multidrug resistance protein